MAKNYCFTLNNYLDSEIDAIIDSDLYTYIVIGKEIAPTTGTPHLQCYIQLKSKKRLSYIQKHINSRAHYEIAKGTAEDNVKYCKKDGNFIEKGIVTIKGSNTERLYNEIVSCKTWQEVLKISGIENRMKYAQEVFKSKPIAKMAEIVPRTWQKRILDIVSQPADDRKIIWVYDRDGGKGKTYLSKYLMANKGAFYCTPMKSSDILYMYNNEDIFIYDIPRCTDEDFINYGALEKIKDGIYTSGKYDGKKIYRPTNVHIIVFSNALPLEGKFSRDRLVLMQL